jgi:hypothetical protein
MHPEEEIKLADMPIPDTWLKGNHYHCKECGSELKFLGRMAWKCNVGVKAIGSCDRCGFILIEYENQLPKWINVN